VSGDGSELIGDVLDRYAVEDVCDLTTTGRRSGRAHTVEIWFAAHQRSLFIIGDPSLPDWYRNVVAATAAAGATGESVAMGSAVEVRLGDEHFVGTAAAITDAARRRLAGRLLVSKYRSWLSAADVAEPGEDADGGGRPTSWAYGGAAIEISGLEPRDRRVHP